MSSALPRRGSFSPTNGDAQPHPDRACLDGGLDAAVARAGSRDDRLDLRLLWPAPLVAVAGRAGTTGQAGELRVLVAVDITAWQAWKP